MASRALFLLGSVLLLARLTDAGAMPAMSLPAFKPNITEYSRLLAAAKASLQAAAKQAAAAAVKEGVTYRPIKCPNGQPLVTCTTWDVCKGKCSNKQVCLPDFCGKCGPKCIDLSLPTKNFTVPKLPSLAIKMPNITLPKTLTGLCPANTVLNVTSSLQLSKAAGKPKWDCRPCPAGSAADLGWLKCSLCAPGSYRAAGDSAGCVKCAAGTFANSYGSAACKPCEPGSFAPLSGAFGCMKCPLGFHATSSGSSKCEFLGFSI